MNKFPSHVLLLLSLVLSGCAGITGPRRVDVPLEKLQQSLDRRFPVEQRVLGVASLTLARPLLSLLPAEDRIALTLHANFVPPFSSNSLHGTMTLSGRLALAPDRSAVVLVAPRIDRLTIFGVDAAAADQLARLGNGIAERATLDLRLYTFQPEDLGYAGMRFTPVSIATGRHSLQVTFEPVR